MTRAAYWISEQQLNGDALLARHREASLRKDGQPRKHAPTLAETHDQLLREGWPWRWTAEYWPLPDPQPTKGKGS